jgi:hypothetical protein
MGQIIGCGLKAYNGLHARHRLQITIHTYIRAIESCNPEYRYVSLVHDALNSYLYTVAKILVKYPVCQRLGLSFMNNDDKYSLSAMNHEAVCNE